MSNDFKEKSAHYDHQLKTQRFVADFTITGDATPADKTHAVDVPGVMVLRTQGKTAAADAVETITWAAPEDTTNSTFGLLLDLDTNTTNQVYSVTVTETTAVSASEVVTGPNGASSFITAEGNIGIEIVATGLDLETEDPTFRIEVEYKEA